MKTQLNTIISIFLILKECFCETFDKSFVVVKVASNVYEGGIHYCSGAIVIPTAVLASTSCLHYIPPDKQEELDQMTSQNITLSSKNQSQFSIFNI